MRKFSLITVIVAIVFTSLRSITATPPFVQDDISSQPTAQALALTVGGSHACAVYDDGSIRCWGSNDLGQLGDGTRAERPTVVARNTPLTVKNLGGFARAVVAGEGHTCALLSNGAVKCWGDNRKYQLGNGYLPPQPKPQPHETLTSGVNQIAAGDNHNCAVMNDGAVRCWGSNNLEQIGISADTSASPTAITVNNLGVGNGRTPAQFVAASTGGSCAITIGGAVQCWGDDNPIPQQITGLSKDVSAIAAGGAHYCAIQNGTVKCWGRNDNGELGNGSTIRAAVPVTVTGLSGNVIDIEAGVSHTCALMASGGVKCWGANESGQLGDGTVTRRLTPVDVQSLPLNVTAIAAGKTMTCAIMGGGLKCWGNLSYRPDLFRPNPAPVQGFGGDLGGGIAVLALGGLHSCVLSYAGAIFCWGDNSQGQLGDGTFTSRAVPHGVNGLGERVRNLAAGGAHTCALFLNGTVRCWGKNDNGQVGVDNRVDQPFSQAVNGLGNDIVAVSAGGSHTCALTLGGGVKCWGANNSGQLGTGGSTDSSSAVNVLGLNVEIKAISAGGSHACALLTNGGVKCWGNNGSGQLGVGDIDNRSSPTLVNGLSASAIAIEAGANHTCVLLNNGNVQCWGANGDGQLGDGTLTPRVSPVKVNGLATRVIAISAGGFVGCGDQSAYCGAHTCAVLEGGQAVCWGRNINGQLGNNTVKDSASPQLVANVSNAFTIATGGGHTCVLGATDAQTNDLPLCWGADREGQLASATTIQVSPGGVYWQSLFLPFMVK